MEEIKVGEYVRTNGGYIHYIKRILDFKDNWYAIKDNKDNIGYKIKNKDIVKHSPNIIDLIRVGDYVNGEKVTAIFDLYNKDEEIIGKKLTTEYRIAQFSGLDRKHYIFEQDIKTIATKEQFESIEYKVEE